jgi:RND family efflux transporter MFP subunit
MQKKLTQLFAKLRPAVTTAAGKVVSVYSGFTKPKKILVWVVLCLVVAGGTGSGIYLKLHSKQAAVADTTTGTLQTAVARTGNLILEASGTGTLVPVRELTIGFDTNGEVLAIDVTLGEVVEEGQVLAELDSSSQELALETARQNLAEMTSAVAIANAQQAVASYEASVTTAQIAVNNLTHKNQLAINQAYATYILAQQRLEQAQAAYNSLSGLSDSDPTKASAYQSLYQAQVARNQALYTYNCYTGNPSQQSVHAANAALALAQANLEEARNYLAALTGGEVPADATGASLQKLRQTRLTVETAQANLDATQLKAPFSGTIMSIYIQVGAMAGGSAFTIADLSQAEIDFYMDQDDWSNVKVGYQVQVIFDALPDQTFTGTVTEVQPGLVSAGGSSMVEGVAVLDDSYRGTQLPTGVSAAIDVISGQSLNVVLVPVEALHKLSEGQYAVFVMQNDDPKLTMVGVGLQDDTFVEIRSGVKAGDVVTTGVVETNQ